MWISSLKNRLPKVEKKAKMTDDTENIVQQEPTEDTQQLDLEKKVNELEEEVSKLRTSLYNQVSDNARLQRIAEREKSQQDAKTRKEIAKMLLPVTDDLERAYSMLGDDENRKSVEFILGSLVKVLEQIGLEPIDPTGEMFDPYKCELGGQEASDLPNGTVCRVVRKGYAIGDEIIRPATVVCSVCQKKDTEEKNE
ncbi:MAG: nucleotide exchange factor GrpE [Caldisericia bacterium]|nr:nucleotide exchange factor GrpE [Caldisericia bacterium]